MHTRQQQFERNEALLNNANPISEDYYVMSHIQTGSENMKIPSQNVNYHLYLT